jgi:hypothetical protein
MCMLLVSLCHLSGHLWKKSDENNWLRNYDKTPEVEFLKCLGCLNLSKI